MRKRRDYTFRRGANRRVWNVHAGGRMIGHVVDIGGFDGSSLWVPRYYVDGELVELAPMGTRQAAGKRLWCVVTGG